MSFSDSHPPEPLPHGFLIELGTTPPEPCPYLGDCEARLDFCQTVLPEAEDFDELLARGYRRHGALFYRPSCPGACRECVPIRIPVADFRPSRSQRRLLKRRAEDYVVRHEPPQFRAEHLELFNRHALHVSSDARALGAEEYVDFLLRSAVWTGQFEYRLGNRLAGVGILDMGKRAASSIYFYWDPDLALFTPGTFSALYELEFCRQYDIDYYYLGYWVDNCARMSYKTRFRPHELMDWTTGEWRRGES